MPRRADGRSHDMPVGERNSRFPGHQHIDRKTATAYIRPRGVNEGIFFMNDDGDMIEKREQQKMRWTLRAGAAGFILVMVLSLVQANRSYPIREMTLREELAELRAQMDAGMPGALSNYVVGITRIVDVYKNFDAENIGRWKAEATVEYVNIVGGIQRTSLPIRAHSTSLGQDRRTVVPMLDFREQARREAVEFERRLNEIGRR